MKPENFRDYAVGIAAIIFSLSTIYSTYQMYISFSQYPSTTQKDLYVSTDCKYDYYLGGISAIIKVQNIGDRELKNIKCIIIDEGGLITDIKEQSIDSLTPQSSDICYFKLEGNYTRPLKFEINYDSSSIKVVCEVY